MKRPRPLPALAALLATLSPACLSGPQRLSTGWDGWVDSRSAENAVVHETVLQNVLPVYPIVGALAGLADFLIVNPWAYWTDEAPPVAEEAGSPAPGPDGGERPAGAPRS